MKLLWSYTKKTSGQVLRGFEGVIQMRMGIANFSLLDSHAMEMQMDNWGS